MAWNKVVKVGKNKIMQDLIGKRNEREREREDEWISLKCITLKNLLYDVKPQKDRKQRSVMIQSTF